VVRRIWTQDGTIGRQAVDTPEEASFYCVSAASALSKGNELRREEYRDPMIEDRLSS